MNQNQIKLIKRILGITLLLGLVLSVISTYAAQRAPQRALVGFKKALPKAAQLPRFNPVKFHHFGARKPAPVQPAGPAHLFTVNQPQSLVQNALPVVQAVQAPKIATQPQFTQEQIDDALQAARFDDEPVVRNEAVQPNATPQVTENAVAQPKQSDFAKPFNQMIEEGAHAYVEKLKKLGGNELQTPVAQAVPQVANPAQAVDVFVETPEVAQEIIPESVTVIDVVPTAVHVVPEVADAPVQSAEGIQITEEGVAQAVPASDNVLAATDVIDANVYDPQLHNGHLATEQAMHVIKGVTQHAQKGKLKRTVSTKGGINRVPAKQSETAVQVEQAPQLPEAQQLKENKSSIGTAKKSMASKRRAVKALPRLHPKDAQDLARKRAQMNLNWEQKIKEDARARRLAQEEERERERRRINKRVQERIKEKDQKKEDAKDEQEKKRRAQEQLKRKQDQKKKDQEIKEEENKEKERKEKEEKDKKAKEEERVPEPKIEVRDDIDPRGRRLRRVNSPERLVRRTTRRPVVQRARRIDPRPRPEPVRRPARRIGRPEVGRLRWPIAGVLPIIHQQTPEPERVDPVDPVNPTPHTFERPEVNPRPRLEPEVQPEQPRAEPQHGRRRQASLDILALLRRDLDMAHIQYYGGRSRLENQLQRALALPLTAPIRACIEEAVAAYKADIMDKQNFEKFWNLYHKVRDMVVAQYGSTAIPRS